MIPGPPRPSAIIRPGGFSLPAGTERYTVPGGGALLVEIEAGDKVTIANAEGGQACELVALDKDGRSDPAILGVAGNSNAAGLKALLLSGEESLRQFRAEDRAPRHQPRRRSSRAHSSTRQRRRARRRASPSSATAR